MERIYNYISISSKLKTWRIEGHFVEKNPHYITFPA